MGRKGTGGSNPELPEKNAKKNDCLMSEYIAAQLPKGAMIDFIFHEDFDGDGNKEAIVGFTRFTPFPPDSAMLFVRKTPSGMFHNWLFATDGSNMPEGIFDNAAAADTDGDGSPELIMSLAKGQEHRMCVYVFDWLESGLRPVWRSPGSFLHGSMEVDDIDGDGIAEIMIEYGTRTGSEIIEMRDTCYHVRKGWVFKWNGHMYSRSPGKARMPYESYNTAVDFLRAIWLRDYKRAYEKAIMPGFIGLEGLDDSSLASFKNYVKKAIRPVMAQNLSTGKLTPFEPYSTCCQFAGHNNNFTIELVRQNNIMKVYGVEITKKTCFNN